MRLCPLITGSVAVRWIRKLYLGLIFAVIGAMLLHNLIIWRRKALLRRQHEHLLVERMSLPPALAACHSLHQLHHARDHGLSRSSSPTPGSRPC